MIPRGAPYIGWSDLFAGSAYCVLPGSADKLQREVETLWAPNTLGSLSVRSGLDALLHVLAFPRGSEIVISAITIPHVVDILSEHGLVAVPVDIDLSTLAIDADDVRSAITPRTKAILVAHIFGSRMPLDEIVAVARAHSLPLLEDCAQANDGSAWRGHADATVSMFSFGSIKRQTALGGGLLRFKDATLAEQVRQQQATYPRQARDGYLKRVMTMMILKAITFRAVFGLFVRFCRMRGLDHDETLGTALRAFSKGDLFARLRQQPSVPLLRMLQRRLRQSSAESVAERVAIVDVVTSEFPELNRPGADAPRHSHWLFPMLTPQPEETMHQLWARGFDATCGASNLISVKAPAGRAAPVQAERLMEEILYLPLYPSSSASEMREMARVVRELEHEPDRAHATLS
jgi:perosamine synthetase